ncbi:MFS transporter [Rhodococcus sp. 27YEA15]|uniref:MFS transporter n=1 Tax=Rhodococcus sp. 27YEA15 TaxID=3156259 RepID=UPI003C7BCB2C
MNTRSTKLPREIWVLVAASFVIALGFGLVAPALPQFALSFDVSVTAATIVISSFAFMRLVFAPMSGSLVQKLGEQPVYIAGLLIVALSTGACAFAQDYWQLLVLRSLGGIGSTMFTVSALGLIIRISPADGRGRVSGLYATSFLMGSIGGPLVGGLLLRFGLRVPFLIYAASLVVAALVVFVSLRGSQLAAPDTSSSTKSMTLREGLRSPVFRAALGSNLAFGGVIFGVRVAMVPLFVVEFLQRDASVAAYALTVFAIGNALVLVASGRLSDRFGRKPFVVAGLLLCGGGTMVMGLTDSLVVFFVISAVTGVGSGLMSPAQQAAIADVVGSSARGGPVLAVFQMMSDVGGVVLPVCAGLLVDHLSYSAAFAIMGAVVALSSIGWFLVSSDAPVAEDSVVETESTRPHANQD